MIRYLVSARHPYTMRRFLDSWGRALREVVEIVPYERFFHETSFTADVHIFSDVERLTVPERWLAATRFEQIVAGGGRALNHPRQVLTRYPLLRALSDAGLNPFRAHRLPTTRRLRYPIFLRTEHEHDGSLTPLLSGPAALGWALLRLARHPRALRAGLLAVEFEDTRDVHGIFQKYSVLRVGDDYVPRHVLSSRDWLLKTPDIVDDAAIEREAAFTRDFPHRAQVERVFELARIDYGRIDYGVKGDRIVVWEINTNPMVVPEPERLHPGRLPVQGASAARIVEAFRALDGGQARDGAPAACVPFRGAGRGAVWAARAAGHLFR